MEEDVHLHCRPRHLANALCPLSRARWMLPFTLLLTGCGGGEDSSTSRMNSSPALMASMPQASSGPSRSGAPGTSSKAEKPAAPPSANSTAEPSLDAASLAQLSALPHLSALSPREKAGLLLLLPSKSSSERMILISMYPSLAQLPVQQKQALLDKLEKIVPVTANQH